MELILEREIFEDDYTLGVLLGMGRRLGYTCEDAVRGYGDAATVRQWKIPKMSAIPYGRYQVIVDFSTRFQKHLPHILDVPGFAGVRFHGGNNHNNTEGCPLIGRNRTKDGVMNCAPVVNDLIGLIKGSTSPVWVTVSK